MTLSTNHVSHVQTCCCFHMMFNWAQASQPGSKSPTICQSVTLNISSTTFPTALRSIQAKPRIPHYSPNTPTYFPASRPLLELFFTQNSNSLHFRLKTSPNLKVCVLPHSQELLTIIPHYLTYALKEPSKKFVEIIFSIAL